MLSPLLVREDEGRRLLLIIDYWLLIIDYSQAHQNKASSWLIFLLPTDSTDKTNFLLVTRDEPDYLYFANE